MERRFQYKHHRPQHIKYTESRTTIHSEEKNPSTCWNVRFNFKCCNLKSIINKSLTQQNNNQLYIYVYISLPKIIVLGDVATLIFFPYYKTWQKDHSHKIHIYIYLLPYAFNVGPLYTYNLIQIPWWSLPVSTGPRKVNVRQSVCNALKICSNQMS